jgi:hypothetical protein
MFFDLGPFAGRRVDEALRFDVVSSPSGRAQMTVLAVVRAAGC